MGNPKYSAPIKGIWYNHLREDYRRESTNPSTEIAILFTYTGDHILAEWVTVSRDSFKLVDKATGVDIDMNKIERVNYIDSAHST